MIKKSRKKKHNNNDLSGSTSMMELSPVKSPSKSPLKENRRLQNNRSMMLQKSEFDSKLSLRDSRNEEIIKKYWNFENEGD